MIIVIEILIALILLLFLVGEIIGLIFFLSFKDVKKALKEVKPIKKEAVIFQDEPKTEEEIAIEREERILKVIGSNEKP